MIYFACYKNIIETCRSEDRARRRGVSSAVRAARPRARCRPARQERPAPPTRCAARPPLAPALHIHTVSPCVSLAPCCRCAQPGLTVYSDADVLVQRRPHAVVRHTPVLAEQVARGALRPHGARVASHRFPLLPALDSDFRP